MARGVTGILHPVGKLVEGTAETNLPTNLPTTQLPVTPEAKGRYPYNYDIYHLSTSKSFHSDTHCTEV